MSSWHMRLIRTFLEHIFLDVDLTWSNQQFTLTYLATVRSRSMSPVRLPRPPGAHDVTGRPRPRCENRQNGLCDGARGRCGPLRAPPSPVHGTAGNVTLKVHARLASFVRRDPSARMSRVWTRTAQKRRDPAGRAGQDALPSGRTLRSPACRGDF